MDLEMKEKSIFNKEKESQNYKYWDKLSIYNKEKDSVRLICLQRF